MCMERRADATATHADAGMKGWPRLCRGCADVILETIRGGLVGTLIRLEQDELDRVISIAEDGSVDVGTDALERLISRVVGLVRVRVGVAGVDYLQHEDGAPEPSTRSASGIWWHSHGDDTATIGGFVIDGLAMTVTTEGEGESPVAESDEVVDRATRAIASQHEGAVVVESGLVEVPGPAEAKRVRVLVTRDHRVRRPQDLLQ